MKLKSINHLFVAFLEMFHEHSHDHVNEYKLCHQDKNDEEYWCDNATDAAVFNAIRCVITVVPQGVFHYAVPVIPGRDSKKGEKSHPEVAEMCVLPQPLAWYFLAAFYRISEINYFSTDAPNE